VQDTQTICWITLNIQTVDVIMFALGTGVFFVPHRSRFLRPAIGIEVNLPDSVYGLIRCDHHREPASFHAHVEDAVTRVARRRRGRARRDAYAADTPRLWRWGWVHTDGFDIDLQQQRAPS
jgi:hypothetical protein